MNTIPKSLSFVAANNNAFSSSTAIARTTMQTLEERGK